MGTVGPSAATLSFGSGGFAARGGFGAGGDFGHRSGLGARSGARRIRRGFGQRHSRPSGRRRDRGCREWPVGGQRDAYHCAA